MIDFCILGSGIAGSTIADLLSKQYSVEVFDKARGPGGRSANKRFKSQLSFDHGTQYISPKTKEFQKFINNLLQKKIVKVWHGNHLDFSFDSKKKTHKYIGTKKNNDICKFQLKKIKQVYSSQITRIDHKKNYWEITINNQKIYNFKSLILTCPYPQLKKLAKKYLNKIMLDLNVKMEPNITLMLAIKNQKNIPVSSIKFNDDILAWAANENSKNRFKSTTNLWTLQSTSRWAKKYINSYRSDKKIINKLKSRFLTMTGFNNTNVSFKKIHGWKYSYNLKETKLKSYWNSKINFGVCGDWFLGPKVENSWQSANDLLKKIKKNPLS